jgi:hypothetical protein
MEIKKVYDLERLRWDTKSVVDRKILPTGTIRFADILFGIMD